MTEKSVGMNNFDEFPMSPTGVGDSRLYYNSYLRTKELFREIPLKEISGSEEEVFSEIFSEVHANADSKSALYRRNPDAKDALTIFWISKVRSLSKLFVALRRPPPFQGLSREFLSDFAKRSVDVDGIRDLATSLLDYGVILVVERGIPGMKLDGAAFKLETGHPVIALSLRYARLDSFWFTLMHELAHVVLHYDHLGAAIVDDLDETPQDLIEKEADKLASNSLISRSAWRSCRAKYDLDEQAVFAFATEVGIHPSIVAGRLRKELNKYNLFSGIVNSVDVRKVFWG